MLYMSIEYKVTPMTNKDNSFILTHISFLAKAMHVLDTSSIYIFFYLCACEIEMCGRSTRTGLFIQ